MGTGYMKLLSDRGKVKQTLQGSHVTVSQEQMSLSKSDLLRQLQQMDEYEFEELVGDVWEAQGWDTTVTSGSSDRGIDVIAEKDDLVRTKMLIQAKRYDAGNKVGSPEIQQYDSLRRQEHNVDAVVVVTTSSFSQQAQVMANKLNVKLIDGTSFVDTISDIVEKENVLRKYGNINLSRKEHSETSVMTDVEGVITSFDEERGIGKVSSDQFDEDIHFHLGVEIDTPHFEKGEKVKVDVSSTTDGLIAEKVVHLNY